MASYLLPFSRRFRAVRLWELFQSIPDLRKWQTQILLKEKWLLSTKNFMTQTKDHKLKNIKGLENSKSQIQLSSYRIPR